MKIYQISILQYLFAVFFFITINANAAEEPPDVTIVSAWFSDDVDIDGDGYYSYRRLNFDLDVSFGSRTVYGIVSCCKKPILAGPCDYATTPDFTVTGTGSGDATYLEIGSPNGELSWGDYQVDLCIYDAGTDEQLTPWYQLGVHGFEETNDDEVVAETYSISGAYMGNDFEDLDGDGYNQWREFCFDANVSSGSHNVYAKIYYLNPFWSYFFVYYTTGVFTITGSESEYQCLTIGTPNMELSHDVYDFRIEVIREGHKQPEAVLEPEDDHDLDDQWFETEAEDQPPATDYSIAGCYMGDEWEDLDGDGYNRWRNFYFDANVASGTEEVYAKIFFKGQLMSHYEQYYTTGTFSITGTEESYEVVTIGTPNTELPHDIYDFRIELYDADGPDVVAVKNPADDHDLDDQWFETIAEDPSSTPEYSFGDCYMGDEFEDQDGDEYNRWRNFYFQTNISFGTGEAYAKLYYKGSSMGSFELYYTTGNFTIDEAGHTTEMITIGSPNMELSHDIYDFRMEIVEAGGTDIVAEIEPAADHDLGAQWFETAAEDQPLDLLSNQGTGFTVFPNPAQNALYISGMEGKGPVRSVILYALTGEEIIRQDDPVYDGPVIMDVSGLSEGVYVLLIQSTDLLESHRIHIR